MKRLFPLFLILINLSSFSQNFVEDHKQWNIIIEAFGPGGISSATEIFYTSGDTIIDDDTYKRIYRSGDSLVNSYYNGALREADGQVFYRNYDGIEGLLYDFNMNKGDSAYIVTDYTYGDQELLVFVDSVDFIELNGAQKKRMFIIDEYGLGVDEEYWIEGIGSNNGLLYTFIHYHIICPWWRLSCCYENGNQIYQNENLECYANNVGIEDISHDQVQIAPNPIQRGENLLIKFPENSQISLIECYDLSGNMVLSKQSQFSKNHTLDLSDLAKGSYIMKIKNSNNQEFIKKLIIQ